MTFFLVLLLSAAIYGETSVTADSTRAVTAPAELLRIANNRLYLWVDSPYQINADFRMELEQEGKKLADCAIAQTADQIAITDTLEASVITKLQQASRVTGMVYLSSDNVGESLLVAIPSFFISRYDARSQRMGREEMHEQGDSLVIAEKLVFLPYDSKAEAEIDLAIGRVDLLLLPSLEISVEMQNRHRSFFTEDYIEWYIMVAPEVDDLYATALNYCLKKSLAGCATQPVSLLFSPHDIETIFPRNREFARSLFTQLQCDKAPPYPDIPLPGMFPSLAERLRKDLQSCGCRAASRPDRSSVSAQICYSVQRDRGTDTVRARVAATAGLITQISERGNSAWLSGLPDTCRSGFALSLTEECCQSLSRSLSEECHIIHLGRMRLMLIAGSDTHVLLDRSGTVTPGNFYRRIGK